MSWLNELIAKVTGHAGDVEPVSVGLPEAVLVPTEDAALPEAEPQEAKPESPDEQDQDELLLAAFTDGLVERSPIGDLAQTVEDVSVEELLRLAAPLRPILARARRKPARTQRS